MSAGLPSGRGSVAGTGAAIAPTAPNTQSPNETPNIHCLNFSCVHVLFMCYLFPLASLYLTGSKVNDSVLLLFLFGLWVV